MEQDFEGARVVGIETIFHNTGPISRYLVVDEDYAPKLTVELVDQILDSIDVKGIEAEAMRVGGIGQKIDIAGRTLELIRAELHSEIYGAYEESAEAPS